MTSQNYWPAAGRTGYPTEGTADFSEPYTGPSATRAEDDQQAQPDIRNESSTQTVGSAVEGQPPYPSYPPQVGVAEGSADSAESPRPTAASLLPRSTPLTQIPAQWGWRGQVRRLSGGLIELRPTEEEVRHRAAKSAVRRSFVRPMTVMFANPKGGAGKTPATLLAGATFGSSRGGYVVAWDNNETRGTLGVRGLMPDRDSTVWNLLRDLERFERYDARAGDLGGYVRAQGEALFDVLASDEAADHMAQIGQDEFERLRQVLSRYYKLILIDTGNNVRATNWQSAAAAADLLVVCSSYSKDVAFSASWMLDHLESIGRGDLVERAVTVLSASSPRVPSDARTEIVEHFAARTNSVVEVPYDGVIAPGERIDYATISRPTRDAWLYACAAIADGLTTVDHWKDSN